MSGKRSATTDLNHDNWDKDEEPEERGTYRQATADELKGRVIKKARRNLESSNNKTAFSGFAGFGSSQPSSSSSPFSFLTKVPEVSSSNNKSLNANSPPKTLESFNFSSPATTISKANVSSTNTTTSKSFTTFSFGNPPKPETTVSAAVSNKSELKNTLTNDIKNSESYLEKIAKLNVSFSNWIKLNVDKNAYCVLLPVFKDYEKQMKQIEVEENISIMDRIKKSDDVFKMNIATSTTSNTVSETATNAKSTLKNIFGTLSESSVNATKTNGTSFAQKANEKSEKSMDTEQPSTSVQFSFGIKKDATAESVKLADEQPKTSSFSFGTFQTVPSNATQIVIDKEKPSTSGFSFGTKKNDKITGFSFGSSNTEEKPTSSVFCSSASTSNTFTFGSKNAGETFSFGAPPTVGSNSTTFGAQKPFSFGNVAAPPPADVASQDEEQDEDQPPKVEFKQVVEEDSIYSKKCKVFVKKENTYADHGVGTLYLKPIKETGKTQLLVRADTNLGNILVNIILSDAIPSKRMGKNNVMLVCIPTSEFKKPTPILIRVKTSEEAEELLKEIEAQKK